MNLTSCALVLSCGALIAAAGSPHTVIVESSSAITCFEVEIADSVWSRAKGLMHRESLEVGTGMLFTYDRAQPVSFWMKNVTVPLDMLFVDATGHVVRIVENVEPGSTTPKRSGGPVTHVLEIRGGASKRAQIKVGAHLSLAATPQEKAACPG